MLILSDRIEIKYSDRNFAWFIHNHYNVYGIYEKQANQDMDKVLTDKVVRNIRKIVNNIKPI